MNPITLLLVVVATWRITRLLVRDEFPPVRAVRDWVTTTFADVTPSGELTPSKQWGVLGHTVAYLWTCTWCMSVWVGAGVVFTLGHWLSVPLPWLVVAAASAGAGLLNMVDVEHDQRYRRNELEIARLEDEETDRR